MGIPVNGELSVVFSERIDYNSLEITLEELNSEIPHPISVWYDCKGTVSDGVPPTMFMAVVR
jgi:hypothetical protein